MPSWYNGDAALEIEIIIIFIYLFWLYCICICTGIAIEIGLFEIDSYSLASYHLNDTKWE